MFLNGLQPNTIVPELNWTASVYPSFEKNKKINKQHRSQAIQAGVDWFYNSNLMNIPFKDEENENIGSEIAISDYGKNGIYECFLSKINYDGTQQISKSNGIMLIMPLMGL